MTNGNYYIPSSVALCSSVIDTGVMINSSGIRRIVREDARPVIYVYNHAIIFA